jgi:hypothetical protein
MDFVASQYNKTIPSKSTFSPSDHQLEYKDGETIRFEIPPFQSFIDPRQTYLTFKVRVEDAPTLCTFSKKCGIHSIIDQLRIYDMNSNLQLETIQNYAELAEKLHYYSENKTIRNKRGLTELLEYSSRHFDGELYSNHPARNADKAMLFNSYTTGAEASYDYTANVCSDPNTCEVAVPLYSGVLGNLSKKLFPAGLLTKGLRMELDTNAAEKALNLWSGDGICETNGDVATDVVDSCRFGIVGAAGGAGAVTHVDLYCEKNAGFNQDIISAGEFVPTQAAVDAGIRPVRNQATGAMNLQIGKVLRGFTNANPPVLKDIGTITRIECNAGENAGGGVRVRVHVTAAAGALGNEFIGGAGRDNAGAAQDAKNNTCFVSKDGVFTTIPRVVMSDVKLVVKTAAPPADYVNKLAKQTQTEEGAVHDFLTYSCYRNNTSATESVVQLHMPTINHMATSCLTLCTESGLGEKLYNDNLATITDNIDNYSFLVNNKLQPTRKVDMTGLNATPARTEQVALWESEKALSSARCLVRNLERQSDNLIIGRALALYGSVYNLKADGNLGLRVEYSNSTPPQKNKLWINQIASALRS